MFSGRNGASCFADHDALCAAFRIAPGTPIILTGTDEDAPIERWWGLGEDKRRAVIRSLRKAVAPATTPNYSLFTDAPRWDDLHAIKRIALVHAEFLAEGLPAALHVNGRTDTDFRRWGDYIAARPEVTYLAYEFSTGTGWAGRMEKHAAWLAGLAKAAGRPLALVVRWGRGPAGAARCVRERHRAGYISLYENHDAAEGGAGRTRADAVALCANGEGRAARCADGGQSRGRGRGLDAAAAKPGAVA